MRRTWSILYYETLKGKSETYDYIDSKGLREKAKLLSWLELLENQGPQLPRPYADLLKDGIHELRIKLTGNQIRILYFFCYKDYIVLTNIFIKTTDKVPKSEISKAKKFRQDFLTRFTEKKIKEQLL